MQLIDHLSLKDKETIKHYIQLYAEVAEPAPISYVLRVWNKQKRTLYKALGHKLRVVIPVEIPRNTLYYQHELKAIYETYPIWDEHDANSFLINQNYMRRSLHNDFVFEFLKFIAEQDWCDKDKYQASRLILHQNIEKGYIETVRMGRRDPEEVYHFQAFKATIKNNMRTVRTIQKVLKAMKFPYMDLFEEWRNKVSDININKDIKANLVISIHPLDFMTLSDNNCDWSSCMSWTKTGSYSSGTIEMMNSNMAVVAYLESKTPYNILFQGEEFSIPNKSWRTLLYVHKHIIVAGKAYPYFNENLTKRCLTEMCKLVNTNLGWTYQYMNQPYKDNQHIRDNFFLKYGSLAQFSRPKDIKKSKHAIYLYTNGMYNDLIEYKDSYWCCRNWVPKTLKLCVSGPATCMCCGDYIENPAHISSYEDIGSTKICNYCVCHRKCEVCGKIVFQSFKYSISYFGEKKKVCSDECLDEVIWIPSERKWGHKNVQFEQKFYFVIGNEENFLDSSEVKNFQNRFNGWWYKHNEVIQTLFKESYFNQYATIVEVPRWVFCNSKLNNVYTTFGWDRRPTCGGYVKFFNPKEQDKDILSFVMKNKQWIPAREVINEARSAISYS